MFRYRLSDAAQQDVLNILAWTHERFGELVACCTTPWN